MIVNKHHLDCQVSGVGGMIDIDDPAQLEMLFLRLQARRVVEAR